MRNQKSVGNEDRFGELAREKQPHNEERYLREQYAVKYSYRAVAECAKNSAPGWTPCKIIAARKIAVTDEPGMPSANVGIRSPTMQAFLAISGASRAGVAVAEFFPDLWPHASR